MAEVGCGGIRMAAPQFLPGCLCTSDQHRLPGRGKVTGTPRWITSRLCHFILIPCHRRHIPIQSLLRARALWLHRNVSLCSICWEPANRRRLFRGTHSFALCPGCFLEARVLHPDKLNLSLNVRPPELTRCVLIAAAPLVPLSPRPSALSGADYLQGHTLKAHKEVIKWSWAVWVLTALSPATSGLRAPLGVAGLRREVRRSP